MNPREWMKIHTILFLQILSILFLNIHVWKRWWVVWETGFHKRDEFIKLPCKSLRIFKGYALTKRIFLSLNFLLPHKSISAKVVTITEGRDLSIFRNSFCRVACSSLWKLQRRKKDVVISASILHERRVFNISLKLRTSAWNLTLI